MATIADQSTMTLWPSWVWTLLFITAAAVLVMVVTRSMHERSHARRTPSPAHPARLRDTCDVTGCGYPASQWRRAISVHGPDYLRPVCKGCADEGEAFGWFTTADDLADIENYANGEVA